MNENLIMNEKKLRQLYLIKKKKPYYYYAYKTIGCPMRFSVFLHENCIEKYMTWKPLTKKVYDYDYNNKTPSLCVVYKNNEIISSLVSINFIELFEKIKNTENNDYAYEFYYIDMYLKCNDEHEYYFKLFKSIKQMIKRFLIVKNEL